MTNEEQYKSIAMQLLSEYVHAQICIIGELSNDFEKSAKLLKQTAVSYLDKLDEDEAIFDELVEDSWIADYCGREPTFPCIEGASAEMYVDGKWIKGKIVKGYRFADGVVTIETANGEQYWCGQDRTDIYREVKYDEAKRLKDIAQNIQEVEDNDDGD